MPAVSLDQFVDVLEKSNLISDDQLARVRSDAASIDGDAIVLAKRLVAQQVITQWQAETLLAGRHAFFLGRFKLLERIGVGGMGSVFKAQQEPLGRLVAIKVISRKLVRNQESIARFYREIQSAASLDHPNIVAAYDADHAGKTYFLVMEYVDGEDLSALVKRRGPLPIGEACHYIMQAAQGLQHAFERHLVHRDIKPSNILVSRSTPTSEPVVKLLDMGLARISDAEDEAELTHTGQIMGTPDYIAPEQARDSKVADVRSDIFSLGCTLFRLLTNQVPFGGKTLMEKLMARNEQDAPPVSSVRRDAPLPLDAVVSRMIARDPNDRYQTPADVVTALAPFAHISKSPKGETSVSATASGSTTRVARTQTETTPAPQPAAGDDLQQFLQDLGSEASFMNVDERDASVPHDATPLASGGSTIGVKDAETSHSSISASAMHRNRKADATLKWIVLAGAGLFLLIVVAAVAWTRGGRTKLIVEWPPDLRDGGSLTLDGQEIALVDRDAIELEGGAGQRTLLLTRPGFEEIRETISLDRGAIFRFQPEWTPTAESVRQQKLSELQNNFKQDASKPLDAKRFADLQQAVTSFRQQYPGTAEAIEAEWMLWRSKWPVDQLQRAQLTNAQRIRAGNGDAERAPEQLVAMFGDSMGHAAKQVHSVAYSPDGKLLATTAEDEQIRLWDVETGEQVRQIHFRHWRCHSLSFHPDGKLLAGAYRDRFVGVWNVETGEQVLQLPDHGTRVFDVQYSPDGKTIATSDEAGAQLFDAVSGDRLREWPDERWELGFNRDGTALVTVSKIGGQPHVWDPQTGKPIESKIFGNGYLAARGNLIVCRGNQNNLNIWDWSEPAGELRAEIALDGGYRPPAISPDEKLLALRHHNRLELYDALTGEQREWKAEGADFSECTAVTFSPDGQTLAAGFHDGSVRLFDVATGKERAGGDVQHGIVQAVNVSPDGRWIVSANWDGIVSIWDVEERKLLRRIDAHDSRINDVVFLEGGKSIATVGHDQFVRIWNAETGEKRHQMQDHLRPVLALAVHPDGHRLASGGADHRVRLWNAKSGKLIRDVARLTHNVLCVDFSPDGKLLAAGSESAHVNGIILWDVETGEEFKTIEVSNKGCKVVDLKFSADGERLLYAVKGGGHDEVRIWDLSTGREAHTPFRGSRDETRIAIQPQGRIWAQSRGDGFVAAHDMGYGIEEHRLRFGPTFRTVGDVAFTPDGRHLVTGLAGGSIGILRLQRWQAKMKKPKLGAFP